jgi:hypothetical protein
LGIDVRTAHYRCQVIVFPGPFAEDTSHFINGNLQVQFFEPFHKKISGLFIFIGQGQALDPTTGRRAYFCHFL